MPNGTCLEAQAWHELFIGRSSVQSEQTVADAVKKKGSFDLQDPWSDHQNLHVSRLFQTFTQTASTHHCVKMLQSIASGRVWQDYTKRKYANRLLIEVHPTHWNKLARALSTSTLEEILD